MKLLKKVPVWGWVAIAGGAAWFLFLRSPSDAGSPADDGTPAFVDSGGGGGYGGLSYSPGSSLHELSLSDPIGDVPGKPKAVRRPSGGGGSYVGGSADKGITGSSGHFYIPKPKKKKVSSGGGQTWHQI